MSPGAEKVRRILAIRDGNEPPSSSERELLRAGLSDPDPVVRRASADVLGHASEFWGLRVPREDAPLFERLLQDGSPAVRAEACAALALIRFEGREPPISHPDLLLQRIYDEDAGVRQEAAAALGDLWTTADRSNADRPTGPRPAGAPPVPSDAHRARIRQGLQHALSDPDPGVRFEAAFALASAQEPAGRTVLEEALSHRRLRADAIEGLARLRDPAALVALTRWATGRFVPWTERLAADAARVRLEDPEGGRAVLRALTARRLEVRTYAIHLAARERMEDARERLRAWATRPGPSRGPALKALAAWTEETLPARALEDPDEDEGVRLELLEARPWNLETLRRLAEDPSPSIRRAAQLQLDGTLVSSEDR